MFSRYLLLERSRNAIVQGCLRIRPVYVCYYSTKPEDEPSVSKASAAGSEYFKSIVRNSDSVKENFRQIVSDNKDSSEEYDEKLKQRSNKYAKKFLNRQMQFNNELKNKRPSIQTVKQSNQEENTSQQSNSEVDGITSKPRDWKSEIVSSLKYENLNYKPRLADSKFKKLGQKSERSRNYEEFRYGKKENKTQRSLRDVDQSEINHPMDLQPFVDDQPKEASLELSELEKADIESATETEEQRMERMIKNLRPATRPVVYNLAYFANTNPVLQKFIEMGVMIREWDKDMSIGSFVLKLDWDKDVKPRLVFLHDVGLSPETHALVITKNPMIFRESVDDLNVRVEYLRSKKFENEAIREIITKAPRWLSLSVGEVDTRLGWFQREFNLTGSEVRQVVTSKPKLVTLPLKKPSDVRFGLKELLTYNDNEIKSILKSFPKLFTKDFQSIEANFIFLSQVMKLGHEDIAHYPPVLVAPLVMLKSRFAYLKHLNRVQFDPTKPNFVSLKSFAEHDDKIFCKRTAKTTLEDYKNFLKTL